MTSPHRLLAIIALSVVAAVACNKSTASSPSDAAPKTPATPAALTPKSPTAVPSKPTVIAPIVDSKTLVGDWIADTDGYRRPTFRKNWPPSRFRGSITLNSDGTARWLVLAPDDGHFVVRGTWQVTGNQLELTTSKALNGMKKGTARVALIHSLSPDLLRLNGDVHGW